MRVENVNPVYNNQHINKQNISKAKFNDVLSSIEHASSEKELRKAADNIEAIFVKMVFSTMRKSIPESDGLFKKSNAEKMFEDMLDTEYSTEISKSGIGISELIFDQYKENIK